MMGRRRWWRRVMDRRGNINVMVRLMMSGWGGMVLMLVVRVVMML